MDFLVLILGLYLSWLLVQLLRFIATRRKPSARTRKSLPPGPRPLPVIGNLLELGAKPHKSLARLAKTHGPFMSLKLGQVTTIVVSSASITKEILHTYDVYFSDRTVPDTITAHGHHVLSMAWMPVSPLWRTLRRTCNRHLFAHRTLDANHHLRHRKVQELLSYVSETANTGGSVAIGEAAGMTSLSLLSNTIFSEDLGGRISGSSVGEFREVVWQIMVEAGKPNLSDYFPVLKRVDPHGARRRMTTYFGQLLGLFEGMIDKRLQQEVTGPGSGKNDMLDLLIDISGESVMDISLIKHLFLDIFAAGTDTTSSTLEWAMAELLRNPEKLSAAQIELEKVIGKDNQVEESDISRLPYLQAVVKETLRLHPPLPLLLPRRAGASVEVGGYTIPKDAQVLVNAWAIGRDPATWKDPDTFRPERFLGSDIDVRGQHFELIPFGGGRHICPGLPLAIRMLHLMLGSLIHSFDWRLEPGVTPENMDMDDKFGLTLQKFQPLRAVPMLKNY